MKTRIYSLPLVIFAIQLLASPIFAQSVAHTPLFAYLDRMPESPVFPDDAALISTPAVKFEEYDDLNAMEKQIHGFVNGSSLGGTQANTFSQNEAEHVPGSQVIHGDENIQAKQLGDQMLATLKDIQSLKAEFEQNFKRLENIYNKSIDKVYETSRIVQKENPCGSNTTCLRAHARAINSGIIAATREKTVNEQYLLSVYLARVKPTFRSLDEILAGNSYGDGIGDTEVKNLFRNAQQDEFLFLSDIIERLKLERITISNCARLAQQYQEK
jgi:hypothetical protein